MSSLRSDSSFKSWIRGVNIGGWLLAERFITPYLFALNSCQLQGDWCFYPDQIDAPPTTSREHKYCDLSSCEPHLIDSTYPMEDISKDYPMDEKSLLNSFSSKALAKKYMTFHWDNFVTLDDIKFLKVAGAEYVRVPMPHYVMNDILDDEPYVDGQWLYFIRFVGWCREYNIKVWIDMHTTFGSQVGFEVNGDSLPEDTKCQHWITSPANVERSLNAVRDISQAVMDDNLRDVVNGFGILNSPAAHCPLDEIKKYSNDAFKTVRSIMGDDTAVYMSDSFKAVEWNDRWWNDPNLYSNTYIDSHYYHVFYQHLRALTPKQHVAYTCDKLAEELALCCFDDHPNNSIVSKGVGRIVGEWSAAYDILPQAMVKTIMQLIHDPKTRKQPLMDRSLSAERKRFLAKHVQAQMVSFENIHTRVSSGWFFYTLKVEGGAFAEWDFSRGVREGWIHLPDNRTSSESIFGSCQEIAESTDDNESIVHEYPDPSKVKTAPGPAIDDDFVISHAGSGEINSEISAKPLELSTTNELKKERPKKRLRWFRFFTVALFGYGIWHVFLKDQYGFGPSRSEYTTLNRQFNF